MKPNETNTNHEKQFKLLGRFFREFRFSYGLTQIELSENTYVHRRTIQRLESGKNITLESIIKISDFYGFDIVNELFGEKIDY